MKMLVLVCSVLFTSAFANATSNFSVSAKCQQSIVAGLKAQNLILAGIKSATFYPGGSDGASSWDDEYIINAWVVNKYNTTYGALISVEDSNTCRVLSVSKIL